MRALACLAVLMTSVACANTDIPSMVHAPDPARRLQEALDRAVALRPGRSGVLLVDVPGGLHFEGASGVSDPHTGRRAEPGDRFRIASITKMVTATLVMMLVEEGRVRLDGNLLPYLPAELVDRLHVGVTTMPGDTTSRGREVTVRHLLGHTSGLSDYYGTDLIQSIIANPRRHWEPLELVERVITRSRPLRRPGEGFLYGDSGYLLLGLVAEATTGLPLHHAYRKRVLGPFGMADTYLHSYEPETPGWPLAYAYSYLVVTATRYELPPYADTASWAGSGLVSDADDLARFARALFEGGLLREPSLAEMRRWLDSGNGRYGLGLMRVFAPGAELWGHTGQWGSFLYYGPHRRVVIAGTLNDSEANVEAFLAEVVRVVEDER